VASEVGDRLLFGWMPSPAGRLGAWGGGGGGGPGLVSVTHSLVYLTKSAGEARNGERA